MNKEIKKNEPSLFEECLLDCIMDWQVSKEDPNKNLELVRDYARELLAIALNPIPCWNEIKQAPHLFDRGLHYTPIGEVLIHDGYYVRVEDLVERLPKTIDE